MSGPLPIEQIQKSCAQPKRGQCVRILFATAQQPHSTNILNKKKCLRPDKLINQQEGILANKVINGTYLLHDSLNHGDIRHQIQLRNIGDLRRPLYAATHSQLYLRYLRYTWNGLSGDLCSSSSLYTFKNKSR